MSLSIARRLILHSVITLSEIKATLRTAEMNDELETPDGTSKIRVRARVGKKKEEKKRNRLITHKRKLLLKERGGKCEYLLFISSVSRSQKQRGFFMNCALRKSESFVIRPRGVAKRRIGISVL